ncbi:DUF4105 domain-containing protein [Massilibacteroides sp.]|uniref:lipoprotein N-acyltransferase Lnb domain-containing protein n=1 Tax=Massilibacteroides sp. TaxID=2034766 RepID=UPI0026112484|nr:DUF4105 domain-containing protein [Massilibacteroides sp.]MDD4515456.1 DUF4105 domain-containing protein [Massilibacteroides sp.]
MRKYVLFFLLLAFIFPLHAEQMKRLNEEAEISVLISGPSHDAVFTLYGHAAMRINDPGNKLDVIFNYGIFDDSKSNFIYNFAKGETDYKLGVTDFLNYLIEYQMRGSSVTELVLNLTTEEKNRIWNALLINYQPENRGYRYNFFFDNCATRMAILVEQHIDGQVIYNSANQNEDTFRDLINYCTREHKWQTFGCDLALGSPTDRIATLHEKMFLPQYLEEAFITAKIRSTDGTTKPLVKKTISLAKFDPEINNYPKEWISPLLCSILLLLTISIITWLGWRKKKYSKWLDFMLFTVAGIAGCILFFLSFISVHPAVFPNWSLLWLHPFHLVGALLIIVKRFTKAAYYYHFINFVALTLLLPGWFIIPQHLNIAFIPLILTLLIRSAYVVYRHKR